MEVVIEHAAPELKLQHILEDLLQQLITKTKQEESKIADVITAKFTACIASLNSRKRKIEAELVMNTSYYVTDIHSIQVAVVQKRSNLIDAIKKAKELRTTHSLESCHSLNQALCNLNVSVEEEVLKLDNLKKRTLPRYNFEESSLKINNELGTSHQVNVNLVKEVDVIPSEKSDTCFGGAHLQEMSPLSIQKQTAALSQATSTPDVIIEEIIEDDQEKDPEYVIVSCVINPCHFYVRKVSQKKTAIYLEKVLKYYCRNNYLSPIDVLELGTRILVKSKEHGMWCRAEIIELIPLLNTNEGKPYGLIKHKICDIAIMKVFLIDFGHPEALIISRVPNEVNVNPKHVTLKYMMIEDLCLVVRKMDLSLETRLRGINKLALQCSLKGIVPKDSEKGWGRKARTEFLRMVNSKAVLMKIFREENGVLIVDLMKPPANKISSDMPVSLRDALVFLDLASFQNEFSDWSKNTVPLEYYPPVMPRENTEVAAVLEQGPEFAAFLNKVEEVYENEAGPDLQILCPTHGQPCVAKFKADGVWYRAQVIGLPGHQEVEVKYVDYGNTAKINVKEMRKIKDEFLVPPEKAIRCKLAYIKPCKEATEWTVQSKDRFEQLIQDKCVLCFVTEKSEDNVLSVELYRSVCVSPKQSGSVNNLLVKEGFASYIIGNSKMIVTPYNEIWDPDLEDIFKTEKSLLKLEIEDLPQMEDLVLEINKELQVQINHIVSPSKIFVHFMLSEKVLKRLQENMIATYFETENKAIKWEADMNCAAYVCEQNQWQRGKIIRIISEKVVEDTNLSPLPVKIFCKDEQHCTDVSEYMIQKGLALRKRAPNIDPNQTSSDELQRNVDINKLVSKKENPSKIEKHFDPSDTDRKQQKLKMSVAKPLVVEAYKPSVVPSVDCFSATVSCVSDNGTIYVIPTSQGKGNMHNYDRC
ncbi:RING finger protein 17, partial [Ophiophagus hannah]